MLERDIHIGEIALRFSDVATPNNVYYKFIYSLGIKAHVHHVHAPCGVSGVE